MEALEVEGQRAAARGEESRYQRNRAPAEASASSGYGVPGREASAPTLDVGPFPALSTPRESAGPSVARSAPEKDPLTPTEPRRFLRGAFPRPEKDPPTLTEPRKQQVPPVRAPRPAKNPLTPPELQPCGPRCRQAWQLPTSLRALGQSPPWLVPSPVRPETHEKPSPPWTLSRGRMGHEHCSPLFSKGVPALYEQLGRLDCLGAAASMRHVREQGAYTRLHDTFHHPVGGGAAELAIGNWMLAFCAVLIEPSVSRHWTGRNDDAAGSFVESWIYSGPEASWRCQQPQFAGGVCPLRRIGASASPASMPRSNKSMIC